jgi:hypothetical protein
LPVFFNLFKVVTTIPDEILFKTWFSVAGFSFTAKKWGEILVEYIDEIVYDETAFDKLILDGDRKVLIECLVMHSDKTFSDFIRY